MFYLIEAVNTCQQPAVIRELVDFAWDLEQIGIAPYDNGLMVDFGEPLGGALERLIKRLGKCIRPVVGKPCHVNWQVVHTNATPED